MARALFLASLFWVAACGGHHNTPPGGCPQLQCKISCGDGGTKKDDNTGCTTCLCAGLVPLDAGAACPALSCSGTCGLGQAKDPLTGCDTCACCNPADCQPGGCHGFGADGCPTCGPC